MLFPRPAVFISFILVIRFFFGSCLCDKQKGCKIKCKQLLGPHKLWKCNLQRCNAFLAAAACGTGAGVGVSNRKLITEQAHLCFLCSRPLLHTYIHIYHIYSIHMKFKIFDTYEKFMYFFFVLRILK